MTWIARRYLVELVLVANAGAFGVLLAELLLLDHTDGIQLIAPVTASTGLVLSLAAIVMRGPARLAIAVAFVILSGAGLIGVARHFAERDGDLAAAIVSTANAQSGSGSDDDDDDHDDHDDGDNSGRGSGGGDGDEDDDLEPPPLAPLALSGSAILGAIASLAGVPGRDEVRRERRL